MKNPKSPRRQKHTQHLSLALKILFACGLMYFLVQRGLISVNALQRALTQWEHILPAFACFLIGAVLGVVRWRWLLEAQGIHLSWSRTFQLNLIGNFFNIALPGAVSGDLVKAFYIGKEIKGQRARAFGSILFDRVAGLSALFLVSGGAILLGLNQFWNSRALMAIQVPISIFAATFVFLYAYLFFVNETRDPVLRILRRIEDKIPQTGSFVRIYEGLRHYHHHRMTVIKVVAISVLVHVMIGWACWNFGLALGETDLALLAVYLVVPMGLLVTAIPIAPAGVGTGNFAFLYLFKLIGSERGADIFSLVALCNILIGAIGGIVYLRFRAHEPEMDFNAMSAAPASPLQG